MNCDHCENTDATIEIDVIPTNSGELHLCDDCQESRNKSLQDGKVGEAGAVFAFMGWLTCREGVSGPFSFHHEASDAARLAGKFCEIQGWEITDEEWHRHIKPYPANS